MTASQKSPYLFECVVYERATSWGRPPRPWEIDGYVVSREISVYAENSRKAASKARYSYWLNLRDGWEEIKFSDIRVRSLAKRNRLPMVDGWESRMVLANSIIRVIAAHGRHFFSENSDKRELVANPFVSYFYADKRSELWFVDRYTRKPILIRLQDWNSQGWSNGGTLRAIVEHLALHIESGNAINPGYFGRSPDWMKDHWGYGESILKVSAEVRGLLEGCS